MSIKAQSYCNCQNSVSNSLFPKIMSHKCTGTIALITSLCNGYLLIPGKGSSGWDENGYSYGINWIEWEDYNGPVVIQNSL